MHKITLAIVYRSVAEKGSFVNALKRQNEGQAMQIDGHDVRFLIDTLKQQSDLRDIHQNVWRLNFFEDSPFKQQFYVSVVHHDAINHELSKDEMKELSEHMSHQAYAQVCDYLPSPREIVKATFIHTRTYSPSANVILAASYLVRGTSSMQFDTMDQHSDRFIHVDGRGTVLLSPDDAHQHTFKRQVILLALSKAYLLAMNSLMNSLANDCENADNLKKLYKEALIFNARHFFANPVKVNRYDAFQLWQGIRQCMMIDDINDEVIQQLKSVHQILGEEEENQQMKAELRLNKRLGWLGIGIGILSLISLFEITPEKIQEFVSHWWQFFNR